MLYQYSKIKHCTTYQNYTIEIQFQERNYWVMGNHTFLWGLLLYETDVTVCDNFCVLLTLSIIIWKMYQCNLMFHCLTFNTLSSSIFYHRSYIRQHEGHVLYTNYFLVISLLNIRIYHIKSWLKSFAITTAIKNRHFVTNSLKP